ncbi:hypothetical protein ACI65C_003568 [Semiaphis heraclei]
MTQADVVAKKNQTVWTPEIGYSRNSTPFDVPWRVTGDTVDNAVRLIFDMTNDNLGEHCPKRESGLTLLVHNPADVPVGIQPTAYVTGSSMLSVALSLNIIRTSDKIKKWTPKLRNCYFEHEKKLKFFKIYTLHNCELECRANNTLNECGCNAYFQPRDPGVPVCGTESLECIRESSTIGIQPQKLQRTSKTIIELPRENLSEAELVGKSTSDRTKRRVAHQPWFPLPVISRLVAPEQEVAQPNKGKNHVLVKESLLRIKPCNVRQINETVDLDSRAQHSKSTSSGVDYRVKANKRKLGELDFDEWMKKKQKKGNVVKLRNKDVKQGKKSS